MKDNIELENLQGRNTENNEKPKIRFPWINFCCSKHQTDEEKKLIPEGTVANYQSHFKDQSKTPQINIDSINENNYYQIESIKLLKAWALKIFPQRKSAILTFNGSTTYFKKLIRNTLIETQQIEIPKAADVHFTRERPELLAFGILFSTASLIFLMIFLVKIALGYGSVPSDHNINDKKEDMKLGHTGLIGTIISFVLLIFFLSFIFKIEKIPLLIFNAISNCRRNYEYNTTFKIDPIDFEREEDIEKCESKGNLKNNAVSLQMK